MKFIAEFYGNDEEKAEYIYDEFIKIAKNLKYNCECIVVNDDNEIIVE